MKRSLVSILALAAIVGCFDDPTSAGRNGPARLRMSLNQTFLDPNEEVTVQATVLDEQGNQLFGAVTFSSDDPNIATAEDVADGALPGGVGSTGLITAGTTAGATWVRATAGGVTDSIYVVVVPPTFAGTITPAAPTVSDTVTISTSGALLFVPANVTVSMGGAPMQVVSATATSVRFIPVFTADGEVMVGGLQLVGTIDLPPLVATQLVNVADPENANDAPGGGLVIASPGAVGDTAVSFGAVTGDATNGAGGDDVDDFFTFTPAVDMGVRVEVEWLDEDVDIDAYVLNAAGGGFCVLDACSGGTSANPETMNVTLVGGTSYQIYVNLWDEHDAPTPMRYIVRIIRTS